MNRKNFSVNTGSRPDCSAKRPQPFDLDPFAGFVGGGEFDGGLVATDRLGDLEPFGEEVDQRRVDVVDARAVVGQLRIDTRLVHRHDATSPP